MEQLVSMNKDDLIEIVIEKDKRIKDLERLVENQRRLRMQDASQFEEKAAKIKRWVTNKLEVLANQNKQLRIQNKKQKETVDSLSMKLAALVGPLASPRKHSTTNSDDVHHIDRSPSPTEAVSADKSLRSRKSHLKNSFQTVPPSQDENQNLVRIKVESSSYNVDHDRVKQLREQLKPLNGSESPINSSKTTLVVKNRSPESNLGKRESPVYDSVTFEMINRIGIHEVEGRTTDLGAEKPVVPRHPASNQFDKWELKLYNLADETFSTLMRRQSEDEQCSQHHDSIDSSSDKDLSTSRKSSSSLKNDFVSLVKPSFTTIDGETVVDSLTVDELDTDMSQMADSSLNYHQSSSDYSNKSSMCLNKIRKESFDSCENINKSITPSLFDSPSRSKSGKESILRTQSVRRNPAPEKLYDFIVKDLVKRGYLIKPGALKNHSRWYVLRNFHLYSYKSETEEKSKSIPSTKFKLEPGCSVFAINQSGDASFPFKITNAEKSVLLIAENIALREEWIRILTVTINLSDVEPDVLTKHNSSHEGILNVTRHGRSKRYFAILINHIIFFLKSLTDPTPVSYLSVKGSKIREKTDNYDYDFVEQELIKQKDDFSDCSLAIYPRYSMNLDPVYITLGCQQEIDRWFYYLTLASGSDQSFGTQFEKTLIKLMINNSITNAKRMAGNQGEAEGLSGCLLKEQSVMLYSDKPITQPLTSLPNETLKTEAIELFKAILLFTQVPLKPIAIDYHVCLLQNCLSRFIKYSELRNEFYAQLIKQCTYILHQCNNLKLSSSSSCGSDGYSPENQSSSDSSLSPSSSECQFVTNLQLLETIAHNRSVRIESEISLSHLNSLKDKTEASADYSIPPSQNEILQVMHILAVAVSLNLPRGRMRWWLTDYLRKFANPETNIGKYALYTLRAIDRTVVNGTRDCIPSRMEIMSILLRNPYDHSNPHSIPVNFSDGSYLVVEADGSSTVDEFMSSITKKMNIRDSLTSDFYLFSDDPSGSKDLHILEPKRKVLDVVGWWEQMFKRNNSGHHQNTKVIRLTCKKRLMLKMEDEETQQERLLIVHQINYEVVNQKVPLTEALSLELAAIMAQLTFGDLAKITEGKMIKRLVDKIKIDFLPDRSSQTENDYEAELEKQLIDRWQQLSGKSSVDCVRVYLNCIRRLKLSE